ncbi:MAG: CbiM family transporter [Bryobacteraceae bacterium]|nr:CbiM family transporter [Bryobacteraceae bacterium]
MHIADGIVPVVWCAAGHAVSLAGTMLLGRKVEAEEVVRMGLLAATSFVVSLIHFPLGGTSVHLGLFGLAGALLGWRAFPVIYCTLLFQALLFQHGGLLALGLNAMNMGGGALLGAAIWRMGGLPDSVRAFLAGFAGIFIPALAMAAEFQAAGYGRGFYFVSSLYLGVAVIEGLLTVAILAYVRKVKPAVLEAA